MAHEYPFYLAGLWDKSSHQLAVINPYDDSMVATTWLAGESEVERATVAAVEAASIMRHLPLYRRAEILAQASVVLTSRRDEIGRALAGEAGKPIRDALTEVDRAAMTFHVASEEARRLGGEVIPLDLAAHGKGRIAILRRFPLGPVAGISPFNFPLNLSAHKIAPAVAAGNTMVLKPASKTPLSALFLAAALDEAGLPKGALSVLPMSRELGDRLVTDDRFKLLTFTGSSPVGWAMKARAGKKKVVLELGGNAGVIVDASANLPYAAQRVVTGGFAYAGQSCISVQRVFVHASVYDTFAKMLVDKLATLVIGNPLDPATDLGPMIDASEVDRIEGWVNEAVAQGARVLTGGSRISRSIYAPTILEHVPEASKVCAQEVFAPVIGLYRFTDFNDAMAAVNRSTFGLQAGVFTNDLLHMLAAYDTIEAGGIIVNDVPTWRIDHMPYGGVKDSGTGREGPRYTIEEMTEPRLLVINQEMA
ncbi:MAG: aldehyde dehydrogenase family protein [Acidobacteria bacterium]|nr:aldehyde dehydrogenase family protein [Acidobacteriota bacterium]